MDRNVKVEANPENTSNIDKGAAEILCLTHPRYGTESFSSISCISVSPCNIENSVAESPMTDCATSVLTEHFLSVLMQSHVSYVHSTDARLYAFVTTHGFVIPILQI